MIKLTGYIQCSNQDEVEIIRQHLPEHLHLSHAEEGCLSFFVKQTNDPMIWEVKETFLDWASFEMHQQRIKDSVWGKATSSIERQYEISEAPSH